MHFHTVPVLIVRRPPLRCFYIHHTHSTMSIIVCVNDALLLQMFSCGEVPGTEGRSDLKQAKTPPQQVCGIVWV